MRSRGARARWSASSGCATRARCASFRSAVASRAARTRRARRRRGGRGGHARRPPGVLLLAGPQRRSAARSARPTPSRSCACCGWPATPARRWSASSSPPARAWTRAAPALGGYGRIFREHVRLSGRVPADHGDHRHLGRRRLLLAGADRLRGDDRGRRACSSPAPASWREVMGEDVSKRGARRPARARAQRRLPARRRRRRTTPSRWRATCSATCRRSGRRPAPRARRRAGAARARPGAVVPAEARQVYDVRDVIRRLADGGRLLEVVAALGAQHGHGVRPHRRPPGRRGRQPAALPGRRDRRRRGREGRRASCAPATRSGCRWWCSSTRPASCPARARSRRA